MSILHPLVDQLIQALRRRDHAQAQALLDQGRRDPEFDINQKNVNGMTIVHMFTSPDRTDELAWLSQAGADFNLRDNHGQTPLMLAVLSSSPSLVSALLAAGADPAQPNDRGVTPLLQAVLNHKENGITRILLDAGTPPDIASETGTTPLLAAASRGRASLVRTLLEAGADPEVADYQGIGLLTSAVLAMDSEAGSASVLEAIRDSSRVPLDPNAPAKSGTTPMAAAIGQIGALDILLDMNGDPNVSQTNRFRDGATLIQSVVGQVEPDLPIKKKEGASNSGGTLNPFIGSGVASNNPDEDPARKLAKKLLAKGADPSVRNEAGRNAGAHAAHNVDVLGDLVAAGLDPTRPLTPYCSTPYDSLVPLMGSSKLDLDAAKAWVDKALSHGFAFERPVWDVAIDGPKPKEAPKSRDHVEQLPQPILHLYLAKGGHDMVWHCIAKGANPDIRNEKGTSLAHLMVATSTGLKKVEQTALNLTRRARNVDHEKANREAEEIMAVAARRLDEQRRAATRSGVKWDAVDNDGDTPLHQAAAMGNLEWTRWLMMDACVDPTIRNNDGLTAAGMALKHGNAEIAYALVKAAEERKKDLRTDLIADTVLAADDDSRRRAIWSHAVAALREPLGLGAADVVPSTRDDEKRHPVFLCAATDMDDVCRTLLSLGGDPEARDAAGNTAMMAAMFNGNGEIIRQLRAMGASPSTTNAAGQSAFDVADWQKSVYLHNMLRDNEGLSALKDDITGVAALAKLDEKGQAELAEDKVWFQAHLDMVVEYFFQKVTKKDLSDHEWERPMAVRVREALAARQAEQKAQAQAGAQPPAEPEPMTPDNIGAGKRRSP